MPELPEVETVVRSLSKSLTGRRITTVSVLHPPSVSGSPAKPLCVCGHRILQVFRRGKFIRIELEAGLGMAIHLRMTGWLGILPSAIRGGKYEPHVRLRLSLDDGLDQLVFRDIRTFGRVWFGPSKTIDALKALAKLGPEPLEISADAFASRLRSRQGRLKALLLNQEFLAGVGNIYADESLFAACLHPLSRATGIKISRAHDLHAAIQSVLSAAIRAGGSSVDNFLAPDGQPGWFQRELRVYGRHGQGCSTCDTPIKRIVIGQRGTWFCPCCQKRR